MSSSELLQQQIITALRMGAVPVRGLERLAVELDLFDDALTEERQQVALKHGMRCSTRVGGGPDGQPAGLVKRALEKARELSEEKGLAISRTLDPELLGKFRACLPTQLVRGSLAGRLLDYADVATIAKGGDADQRRG